jgi:hypothetical protein
MYFQNSSVYNSGNFYEGLMEWDWLKLVYITFHILLTFFAPSVLYGIVWYERFGLEMQYRCLTNMLLSHICWITVAKCLTLRIAFVSLLFVSPLSSYKCDLIIYIGRYSFLCSINEIAIWQLIKYFYISKWQYLVSLNDPFFANFLTMCNLMLSAVFLFVTFMTGHHNAEIDYHICTGLIPSHNILTAFRYSEQPIHFLKTKQLNK